MAWSEALTAIFGSVKKALDVIWGDQTLQERSLEKRAEYAAKEKQQAKEDLRRANIEGDLDGCAEALNRLNAYDAELKRLSDEAAAKRSG